MPRTGLLGNTSLRVYNAGMMLQLNPQIPYWHKPTQQLCYAVVLIDYSQDHDLMFVCHMSNGQIWTVPNKDLRAVENLTFGRGKAE